MPESARRLDASLEAVSPHLPRALVPRDDLVRIRGVARGLPRFAVDFFGFEVRLGSKPGPADCAFNLTPEGARLLAGDSAAELPPELANGGWERVREFYRRWAGTRDNPLQDAGSTWLEVDSASTSRVPNLLFGYWPRAHAARPPEWLVGTVVPGLLGRPLPPAVGETVLRCLELCPPEADDFQVGVMLSRDIDALRLCVFDLPDDGVFAYLDAIGWQGDTEALGDLLEALRQVSDFVGLHLDVGERVYPHIGLEPNFTAGCWTRQPHHEPRWYGLFDRLQERRLVTADQRDGLLGWIGHQRLAAEGGDIVLLRGLSHLKLVLSPDGRALAKAYFGLAHRRLDTAAAGGGEA